MLCIYACALPSREEREKYAGEINVEHLVTECGVSFQQVEEGRTP